MNRDLDEPAPSREVERLVDYCQRRGLPLIIGCDANAHHVVWGSTDINDRDRRLLDFLIDTDLDILNQGNELTFVTFNRKEVLNITICTKSLCDDVRDWRVFDEDSHSDHRLITFRMESKDREHERRRNPRSTDWTSYIEDLKASMEHRKTVRQLFNEAKKRRHPRAWDEYHIARDSYKKEVERARAVSWRSFCEGIERVPEASRLHKVLDRDPMAKLTTIKLPNGHYAQDKKECPKHLMEVNFREDFREGSKNNHGVGPARDRRYREH
ncbi:uncharacterized protein LOC122499983 [Leptopilina heterotoma]|uniref:uncharacterized protein LOC122499983 n=1 Tax=Leptopilina heterotoma TaxID=63436 RepID=UPI001CA98C45|nr:uncharacterized protein LOC122499983 [Leptopilina heterotoma]